MTINIGIIKYENNFLRRRKDLYYKHNITFLLGCLTIFIFWNHHTNYRISIIRNHKFLTIVSYISTAHFPYKKDKIEAIAYQFWVSHLNKSGFPRNKTGSMMDAWQLYNHWTYKTDKTPWVNHVERHYKE